MPDPVTLGSLTLWGLGSVAGGVLGGASDRVCNGVFRGLCDQLAGRLGPGENHHIARAVYTAHIQAINRVVRDYQKTDEGGWGEMPGAERAFYDEVALHCETEINSNPASEDGAQFEITETLRKSVTAVLAPPEHDGPASERADALRTAATDVALKAFRAVLQQRQLTEPPDFEAHFQNGSGDESPGWLALFGAYVARQVQKNDPFRRIFVVDTLARIEALSFDATQIAGKFMAVYGPALDRIEGGVERIEDKIDTQRLTLEEILHAVGPEAKRIQKEYHLTNEVLEGFFNTLGQSSVPLEKLAVALNDIATHYNNLLERHETQGNETSEIAALKERAHEAIKRVDLDEAETLLARAEELALAAIKRREERAKEEAGAIQHERRQAAVTRTQRGEIALTRLDYFAAADHFAAAANMAGADDAKTRWRCLMRERDALYDHGDLFPGLEALRRAISVSGAALQLAPRNERPEVWAATQNNLGAALHRLGERAGGEEGVNALNGAVEAYGAALEVFTRDTMPAQWAATQNNLGAALHRLGERGPAARRA